MKNAKFTALVRHGIAVFTAVPSVLLTLYLHHVVHFTLNIAPLAVITLVASGWVGGFWQGLLAALLLDLGVDYFFEVRPSPPYTLDVTNQDVVRMMVMVVIALLTSWRKSAQTKLKEHAYQQLAVADLGQKAFAGSDPAALLEQAASMVANHLKVDYSILCELLPDGNTLQVKAGVGWRENLVGRTAALAESPNSSERPLPSSALVPVSDQAQEINFSYAPPIRDYKIGSSVSVLIHGNGQPYGVLSALTRRRRRKFSSDEVAYLQAIANVLAEAIGRRRHEEEREHLLAREQAARIAAEEACRLKDEFLATVSHELRTPLNHMLGWVTMLRDGNLSPEKSDQALVTIERNVRAQNRLVDDLLDVSRIVTGRMQLQIQPVIPARIVEAALASIRPAAKAKDVQLHVQLDRHAGTVSGDPDRLQQVVWNLVSNAIKFTPQSGQVQVHLEQLNSHVRITVRDTGEGIPPDFLPHVFDRFSQADGSFKRRHGGLGLGLAIVRHLVELHGGTVAVESPGLDQGATFIVELPLSTTPLLASENEAQGDFSSYALPLAQAPRIEGTRVLVVDDEADARALLMTMLTNAGAEVRVASAMDEALDVLTDWRPDVLVSDIGMPDGDGYDLIQEVRRLEAATGAHLPTIALTAYARPEDRMRALSAGFQMHISKPVEPQELLVVVASLAGRLDFSWTEPGRW